MFGIDWRHAGVKALIAIGLTPIFAAIGFGLVVFAVSLDNGPIVKNLHTDREVFQYGRPPAFNGRKIDVGTECLGMSFALTPRNEGETWAEYAVRAPVIIGCERFLKQLETPDTKRPRAMDYFRYWHGYAVVSRPLLTVFPYRDIRMFTFNAMLLLFFLLARRFYRDFSPGFALAFFLPFFFVNYAGFMMLWTKAVSWMIALGGAFVVSGARVKAASAPPPLLAFFIIGCLTAYCDWLTVPLFTAMFPALVYFLYRRRFSPAQTAIEQTALFLLLCAFWGAGYGGFWAVKFLVAYLVLGPETWQVVWEMILFRLRGDYESVKLWPGAGIAENFEAFKALWGAAIIGVFVIAPLAKKHRREAARAVVKNAPAFALIAASPFIWWEVVSNHSQIHAVYTHVLLLLFLIPMSLTLFGQWPKREGG
ncbi:MAG: hypothetical protein AAF224_04265 [Pseudomonadota bacterium]